jgi:hypothetical protein
MCFLSFSDYTRISHQESKRSNALVPASGQTPLKRSESGQPWDSSLFIIFLIHHNFFSKMIPYLNSFFTFV